MVDSVDHQVIVFSYQLVRRRERFAGSVDDMGEDDPFVKKDMAELGENTAKLMLSPAVRLITSPNLGTKSKTSMF